MATHKVPQDVEAEDKLIGPLSLKQFIFTVLGLGFGYLTFFFFTKVHPLAAVIWLPFAFASLVLGLYQRKDQPVEVFLASAFRFYFKPRKRIWDQDGYEQRVTVTAPPEIEHHYKKDFTGKEAVSRLSSLSTMMDSRGWASKNVSDWQNPQLATAAASSRIVQVTGAQTGIDPQAYTQPVDMLDEKSSMVARDFQARVDQTNSSAKQHAIQSLKDARVAVTNQVDSSQPPSYQKYPAQMHQKVISADPSSANQSPQNNTPESKKYQTSPTPTPNTTSSTPKPSEPKKIIPDNISSSHVTDDGSVEISLH